MLEEDKKEISEESMVMREAVSEAGFGLSVGSETCRRVSKERASFCSSISLLRFRRAGSGSDLRIAEIASDVCVFLTWTGGSAMACAG
jgi:hypothetical protein